MSAPAPLLGEKQTSGGRLAATDLMSTHLRAWWRFFESWSRSISLIWAWSPRKRVPRLLA